MARKVACFITKEKGTNETFKQVIVKGTKKYVKDMETYHKWVEQENERKQTLKQKNEIVETVVKKVIFLDSYVPPIFMSRLLKLNYEPTLLCKCIEVNAKAFQYAHTKTFNNIHQKIGYMIAIINNTIGDVQLDKPQQIKNLYIESDILEDKLVSNATRKRKDISQFLEE